MRSNSEVFLVFTFGRCLVLGYGADALLDPQVLS